VSRGKSCLVGKLVADRIVSKEIIKSTLVMGWTPIRFISFKVLGENLFLVDFEYMWDKSSVLEGSIFFVEDFVALPHR
jgi:hypothetical protein